PLGERRVRLLLRSRRRFLDLEIVRCERSSDLVGVRRRRIVLLLERTLSEREIARELLLLGLEERGLVANPERFASNPRVLLHLVELLLTRRGFRRGSRRARGAYAELAGERLATRLKALRCLGGTRSSRLRDRRERSWRLRRLLR